MVVFRPTVINCRKSGACIPTRKLVCHEPAQHHKRTKAETELVKAHNKDTCEAVGAALEKEHEAIWDCADALHAQHGLHTRKWWHDAIIQAPTKPKRTHGITRWLAYVSKRVREINSKKRKNGEPLAKPSEVSTALSKEWNSLSDLQKAEAVDEYMKNFEAEHEEATTSVQNVPLKTFHDIRAQLQKWEDEADALSARTNVEVLFIAVRTDFDMYNKPYSFTTSSRSDDFFNHIFKSNLSKTALQMESYMLSGVSGLALNYIQNFTQLKSTTAALIHSKLNEAVGHEVSGMKYANFHKYITVPHRLVTRGWPLKKFASPSDIGSKADCELLREAWTSGSCRFEKLDDDQYQELCHEMSAADDDTNHMDTPSESPTATSSLPPDTTDSPPSPLPSTISRVPVPSPLANAPAVAPVMPHSDAPVTPAVAFLVLPSDAPTTSARGRKRVHDPSTDPFIAVAGINGQIVDVSKRPRKVRSDKGIPRGPRKKGKENSASAVVPSPTPPLEGPSPVSLQPIQPQGSS